jgi:AcrR family transcriptional regulator
VAIKKPAKKPGTAKQPSVKVVTTRGRGRPRISENNLLDRKLIIACALQMAREVPLQELSIVRVAKELGVTPALIHYYIEGRDALTSGIMNSFYRDMLEKWPAQTGDWAKDVEAVARLYHDCHVAYPGIAAYAVANTRFRLKQILIEGETDYGLLVFERFLGAARQSELNAYGTARGVHLLIEFLVSTAFAAVRHLYPGEHGSFLENIFDELDPDEFPNMAFIRKEYTRLNAADLFSEALRLFMITIQQEMPKAREVKDGLFLVKKKR